MANPIPWNGRRASQRLGLEQSYAMDAHWHRSRNHARRVSIHGYRFSPSAAPLLPLTPAMNIRGAMSPYTRRNFIKRTAAGTLGFTIGCGRLQVTDGNHLSRDAIDRLRAKLKGRLILPTDA